MNKRKQSKLAIVLLLAAIALLLPATLAYAGDEGPAPEQAEMMFRGVVNQRPDGAEGEWIIGETTVLAVTRTHFTPGADSIGEGDEVRVVAARRQGQLIAIHIEKLMARPHLLRGEITAIEPVDETTWHWTLGEDVVTITADTKLSGDTPEVGALALAWVVSDGDDLLALRVHVKGPKPKVRPVTFTGVVSVVNAGVWTIVSGGEPKTVLTDDETRIVGDPQPGDRVGVKGHLLEDGAILAHHIVKLNEDRDEPFLGWVTEIVPPAEGGPRQWEWTVESPGFGEFEAQTWTVLVDADTRINIPPAQVEVGAWVKGAGLLVDDENTIAARIVKVMRPPRVRFFGVVQAVPGDETFPLGDWLIGDVTVHVSAGTVIEGNPGFDDTAGGYGELQMDDSIEAALLKVIENGD